MANVTARKPIPKGQFAGPNRKGTSTATKTATDNEQADSKKKTANKMLFGGK